VKSGLRESTVEEVISRFFQKASINRPSTETPLMILCLALTTAGQPIGSITFLPTKESTICGRKSLELKKID
jgi:hypothetical protein